MTTATCPCGTLHRGPHRVVRYRLADPLIRDGGAWGPRVQTTATLCARHTRTTDLRLAQVDHGEHRGTCAACEED
ncbi:MAG TPA: hypothetical protein VGA36_09015 [Nitriliruptorales bacterium]